jgi:hypothetical protein
VYKGVSLGTAYDARSTRAPTVTTGYSIGSTDFEGIELASICLLTRLDRMSVVEYADHFCILLL